LGLGYALLLEMGLSYTEIQNLTQEEEIFLIESSNYLYERRYGKQNKKSNGVVKAKKITSDYKNELLEFKKLRDQKKSV